MIVRIAHPEEADQHAFIPLRYHSETGQWVSLLPDGAFFESEFEAGIICVGHLRSLWTGILRGSRLVRALCEHPEFEFDADGVDANMIRKEARTLARQVEAASHELERLLQKPVVGDKLAVDGALLEVELTTIEP